MVKISVIIPTYCPGAYLERAIESLKRQTLIADNFEVLIVLNGPKEPYWTYISTLIRDLKVAKLYYISSTGVSGARNLGIEASIGDYICFLDDDDSFSDLFLKGMLDTAVEINNPSVIVQSNFIAIKDKCPIKDYISVAYNDLYNRQIDFSVVRYRKFLSTVTGKLFNRYLLGNCRFPLDLEISEDGAFLFALSKSIDGISFASRDSIYFRNIREGSVVRQKRSVVSILGSYIKKLKSFSNFFFSDPFKYNTLFYFLRILAVTKVLFLELIYTFRRKFL